MCPVSSIDMLQMQFHQNYGCEQHFIKGKKPDIVFLQETHSQPSTQCLWQNEWGAEIICSHGQSNARGVAVLFRKNLVYDVKQVYHHNNGRYLILDLKIDDKIVTFVNIYVPNEDSDNFILEFFQKLVSFEPQELIIGGDSNFVIDASKDATNIECKNNTKSKAILEHCMSEMMLTDAWHFQNPDMHMYTWSRRLPNYQASRIDYFLINYGMMHQCQTQILPATCTDHSLIMLTIHFDKIKRGKGHWKFNCIHLENREFLSFMNEVIDEKVASFYHKDNATKWYELKNEIIIQSQNWSKNKANQNKKFYKELMNKLRKLKNKIELSCDPMDPETKYAINEQIRINKIYENKLDKDCRGAMIRSRSKWYNEAEIGSSYFLGLERLNYSNKTMKILIKEDSSIIRDQKKIIQEQFTYYKKLYTSRPEIYFDLCNQGKKITPNDKANLE